VEETLIAAHFPEEAPVPEMNAAPEAQALLLVILPFHDSYGEAIEKVAGVSQLILRERIEHLSQRPLGALIVSVEQFGPFLCQ